MNKKRCTAPDIECPRVVSPRVPRDLKMCDECYDYAGWENMHNDNGHDVIKIKQATAEHIAEVEACPVCNPDNDPRKTPAQTPKTPRRGHTNKNAAGKHMSHAMCAHESSKTARAICRKSLAPSDDVAQANAEVLEIPKIETCPKCDAKMDEKCKTASGGRFKGKGGRHAEHPANKK